MVIKLKSSMTLQEQAIQQELNTFQFLILFITLYQAQNSDRLYPNIPNLNFLTNYLISL